MRRSGWFVPVLLLSITGGFFRPLMAQSPDTGDGSRFFDFTIGLGIDAHSAPSVANYINAIAMPTLDQKVTGFQTAAEFFAVPELQVSREWSAGIEYSLLVKSYSINSISGYSRSDISYQVHMPSVLVHYLVLGEGYRLKLGGGVGYHFVTFDESFAGVGSFGTLKSQGLGFKLDAIGNTKFDQTFYGSIGVDLRWDFLGTLKASGSVAPQATTLASPPTMTFFSAGVKFGITFQIL
jgi:hypothetical protein